MHFRRPISNAWYSRSRLPASNYRTPQRPLPSGTCGTVQCLFSKKSTEGRRGRRVYKRAKKAFRARWRWVALALLLVLVLLVLLPQAEH